MPMSDKTLRAINKGRRKAGLKPIRRKKTSKSKIPKGAKVAPKAVHNFLDNKPYGAGRTRAQTEAINRQNDIIMGYSPNKKGKKSGCLTRLEKLKNAQRYSVRNY